MYFTNAPGSLHVNSLSSSKHLPIQRQQRKHQNNMWNLFKDDDVVNFEHISHLFLVFLLLALNCNVYWENYFATQVRNSNVALRTKRSDLDNNGFQFAWYHITK